MLVSVILPVKNAQNTILNAVNSILQQTYKSLELIIIDDNSSDNSIDLLTSIEDHRIKVILNKGNGIANALNTGLEIAQGEYIARMDADDISKPVRLQRQLLFAKENPQYDVISCLVEHNSKTDSQQGYLKHIEWINSILTPEEHYVNRFVDAPVAHPSVFFERKLLQEYGNYSNESIPEDFELWLKWIEQGVQFAKVPEVLYEWSDYPDRSSRIHPNYSADKFCNLKAMYFRRWWQRHNNDREIWIWGYSKEVFKKVKPLIEIDIEISGFIDLKERPNATRLVKSYLNVKKSAKYFYLIYIGDRQGKRNIADYLSTQDMVVSEDYLFMS